MIDTAVEKKTEETHYHGSIKNVHTPHEGFQEPGFVVVVRAARLNAPYSDRNRDIEAIPVKS